MSFGAIERTRAKGRPVNLFYVKYGSAPNSFYAYTDAEKPITNNGVTYQPLAISRGKIVVSGTLDKAAMEVRMTLNVPLAEHFRVYPPTQTVNLTIFQGHLSDTATQFLVAWAGRVISSKRTDNELVITCEPISTSMKRVGLRRHYQYSCMHVLYGSWCKANKAAASRTVAVASVAGTTITLPGGWDTDERTSKYVGGLVEWQNSQGDNEVRTILKVTNLNKLSLSGFLRDLAPGTEVTVVLGCNHALYMNDNGVGLNEKTDCHFLHANIQNFGGCAFIPKKNPVGMLNNYY